MTGSGFRPRVPGDLPALVAALRRVHEQDGYPSVWPEDPLAFVQGGAPLAAWVGVVGGVPAGQVLLCRAPGEGGRLEVKRLFVAPEARGQRLAEQLMRAAQAEGARRGGVLTLQVQEKNRAAQRLYARLGWVPSGEGVAAWTDPDGSHPRVLVFTWPSPGGPA